MVIVRVVGRGGELTLRVTGATGGAMTWTGSREDLAQWIAQEEGTELGAALGRLMSPAPDVLEVGPAKFELGQHTWVMGVVNVTPDSFSDGGKTFDQAAAIAHGVSLAKAGAHLLDVGGESTRPGAEAVSVEEELRRVVGVVRGLVAACPKVPVSIDTSKAAVAKAAVEAGASMINDVTALNADPGLAEVAARSGAALCLMHMLGTPRTMQEAPRYGEVVAEVLEALELAAQRAIAAGVRREKIVIDPGIGFGKTVDHNLELLKHLNDFRLLGYPVLVGTSRKSFLGKLTGKEVGRRVAASAATVAVIAAAGSADFVRVHDVDEALDAAVVGDAIRGALE